MVELYTLTSLLMRLIKYWYIFFNRVDKGRV